MDPRRLLLLRDVARSGSLSGAARALGLTPPAVAQQVRALEAEAGTPLVVRAGRGVALTEAGRLLVAHADAVAVRAVAVPEVDGRVVELLLRPDARRVPAVAAVVSALQDVATGTG